MIFGVIYFNVFSIHYQTVSCNGCDFEKDDCLHIQWLLKVCIFVIELKWLRYQRVISLETQVGVTSQINKWANMDPQTCQRWDQVPRRSKHPLSIGHIRREPSSMIMNAE
jgi:hypothetical protein